MNAEGPAFDLVLEQQAQADPALQPARVELLVSCAVAAAGLGEGTVECGVWFVAPERMGELNAEHRGVDGATDVLSFPIDEADELGNGMPRQLGDVFVCGPYVAEQVRDGRSMVPPVAGQAGPLQGDATVEAALARCVVHGVLHLCGLDHEQGGDEAFAMFALEQSVLDEVAMRTEEL